MPPEIAVIAAGTMGSAVGRRLAEHGARVLTSLAGRSPGSADRAAAAGMVPVSDDEIAGAGIILSIVPPAEAIGLAERLAPALARSGRKPVFADCNAVDVATVKRVAAALGGTGARFVDGGIIGGPPKPGQAGPTFYLSGEAAPELAGLGALGLRVEIMQGPVGAASALKMSYAGITKGLIAIAAAMLLAAARAGTADALHEELAASQAQLLARFSTALPDMYPKAHRWVAEMREIAAFCGEDPAASMMFEGAARLYERLARDAAEGRHEVGQLDAFFAAR